MRKGVATKLAVLDQATELAAKVGLHGLTIGSLAAKAELSKSGLFAHFQSKETLQVEVLRHARERFTDLVIRPAIARPRGEPRARELFERWLGWVRGDVLDGGCVFIAAGVEFDDQPGPVRDHLVSDERDLADTIAHVFGGGIKEGHFRGDADPEQFAQDLTGVLYGYFHAARLLDEPRAEDRARRAFEALLTAAR